MVAMNLRRCAFSVAVAMAVCPWGAGSVLAASPVDDYVYAVRPGDTVIGVGQRLLKVPAAWRDVAQYNRMVNPNRIYPAQQVRIPLDLLRATGASATFSSVDGDVKVSSGSSTSAPASPSVAALGASLAEGAQVTTGKDGYATLKLSDGSTVRVQAGSQVEVSRLRSYADVGILESVVKVITGRVESQVTKPAKDSPAQPRHSVSTRLANLGVRGTQFRVAMDAQTNETRSEVLEGAVAASADGAAGAEAAGKRIGAGFGTVVDASKTVSDPIALLAAPETAKLAALMECPLLRFPLPPVTGAKAYRAQIARDKDFNAMVQDTVSPSAELRFVDVPDGNYVLRVRAIDPRGLEGKDATHEFRLKARPEPPLVSTPAPKGKVRSAEVELKWSDNPEAATYHVQVARDAGFKSVVHENKAAKATTAVVPNLTLGDYFWRVASLRKDGDRGPYGDVASFTLLAPPAQPEPPAVGDDGIAFRWAGEPGQKFEFQLADNAKFAQPLLTRSLDKPEFILPRPGPGTYYMRVRATDPEGFVGPYSSAQRFSLPACITDSNGRCLSTVFGIVGPAQ